MSGAKDGAPVELVPDMSQALADLRELGELFARFGVELISSLAGIREGVPPVLLCEVFDVSEVGTNRVVACFKLAEHLERCLAALRAWDGNLHTGHEITPAMLEAGAECLADMSEASLISQAREVFLAMSHSPMEKRPVVE